VGGCERGVGDVEGCEEEGEVAHSAKIWGEGAGA